MRDDDTTNVCAYVLDHSSTRCREQAIVGLNGRWYCLQHFKTRLGEVRTNLDRLVTLFEENPDATT